MTDQYDVHSKLSSRCLKVVFFACVVRPMVLFLLGLNIINRQTLPSQGPAVIAANHNSHLDTLVLMALFPLSHIHKVRPVAAADYFLSNRWLAWFSLRVLGIIPLQRRGFKRDLFAQCHEALDNGDILLIFPEGSRGDADKMGELKSGVYHLLKEHRDTPVYPVMLHGLGMALPRGEALLVPYNCDVVIGASLSVGDDRAVFLESLRDRYHQLAKQCLTRHY